MTEDQKQTLIDLRKKLVEMTAGVGCMHGAWDFVGSIDAVLAGKPHFSFEHDPQEVIKMCEEYLQKWRPQHE